MAVERVHQQAGQRPVWGRPVVAVVPRRVVVEVALRLVGGRLDVSHWRSPSTVDGPMAVGTERIRTLCVAREPPLDHVPAGLGRPWVDTVAGERVPELPAGIANDRAPVVDAAELPAVGDVVVTAVGTGPTDHQSSPPRIAA